MTNWYVGHGVADLWSFTSSFITQWMVQIFKPLLCSLSDRREPSSPHSLPPPQEPGKHTVQIICMKHHERDLNKTWVYMIWTSFNYWLLCSTTWLAEDKMRRTRKLKWLQQELFSINGSLSDKILIIMMQWTTSV